MALEVQASCLKEIFGEDVKHIFDKI